ncbi:MAG: imidazole glycerol phosphate synthase subunit HisH [Lentimicrobiaceae bacterium]|jgi:imidazole glycerol-phosphate synthase subunit HisH|nr:imidazole glycerol phosphate synthase subunit HisH [Candidatus Scalindua sp.]MBT6671577.1 imidazole glycerol phosphate synthase subunit HisH [Lentimicrobiaceae bacterium]
MISIIDYGMGNIRSIQNALEYLETEYRVTNISDLILSSSKLILPGVGSFKVAMENLNKMDLIPTLNKAALEMKIPILGICLGMQLLGDYGEEEGGIQGLGWVSGRVQALSPDDSSLKVPHIGFNSTYFESQENNIFEGLPSQTDFYYVHGYSMICDDPGDVTSWTYYGNKIVASIQRENICGVQFHPEKSQSNGLTVLNNFINLKL